MRAVLAGDREAFTLLYQDHVGPVTEAVRHHLSDQHQVADAVQASFANALESLRMLRDPERFRPWLLAIARHAAMDIIRAGTWTEVVDGVGDPFAAGVTDPEDALLQVERAELVRACVAGLSKRDATAVTLASLGFGPADVAVAVGVSTGAAKVLLHRARRRLRSALVIQTVRRAEGSVGCPLLGTLWRTDQGSVSRHVEHCEGCIRAACEDLFGSSQSPSPRSSAASCVAGSRRSSIDPGL